MVEQALDLVGRNALGVELAQGVIEGTDPQRTIAAHLAAALLVLEAFLGNVDQAEIDAEGAYHMGQRVRIQGFDEFRQTLALAGVFRLAQADVALAQGLDGVEDLFPRMIVQDLAEDVAEQLDPRAQGLVMG